MEFHVDQNVAIILGTLIIVFVICFAFRKEFVTRPIPPTSLPTEIFKKNRKDFVYGAIIGGILDIMINIPLINDLINNPSASFVEFFYNQ